MVKVERCLLVVARQLQSRKVAKSSVLANVVLFWLSFGGPGYNFTK